MLGHGADHDRTALQLDAGETFDLTEIDDIGRLGEPELHHRDQRMAAGQKLRLGKLGQQIGRLTNRGGAVILEFIHRSRFPYSCDAALSSQEVTRPAATPSWLSHPPRSP